MGQAASFVGIAIAFGAASMVAVVVGRAFACWLAAELLGEAWSV